MSHSSIAARQVDPIDSAPLSVLLPFATDSAKLRLLRSDEHAESFDLGVEQVTAGPRTEGDLVYRVVTRSIDVLVSSMLIAILSPFWVLIALGIRLQDGGPAIYRQKRVGLSGKEFELFKFRSMVADSDRLRESVRAAEDGPRELRFKARQDPRITRLGRLLRRTSLDEAPQLLNVLRGDMTLVGPRPPLPEEVAEYGPRELRRLSVPPGLTCTWQVSGRSELSFEIQTDLDLAYIERRSVGFDLTLLARTIPAVVSGRGAW